MQLKHLTAFFLLLALPLSVWQCGGDDNPNDEAPACNIANADLTYGKNIKRIVDNTCVSCHAGKGPGPGDYTTYAGMKKDIDEGHIFHEVVKDNDTGTTRQHQLLAESRCSAVIK
jgi:hypothetical protein